MTFWIFMAAAVAAFIIGTVLTVWGCRMYGSCTGNTKGVVVDFYESGVSQDRGYAPIVEFYAEGQKIKSRALTEKTGGMSRMPFEIGDEVDIRYDPDKPSHFLITGYDRNIILLVGISGYAAALVMAACAFIL